MAKVSFDNVGSSEDNELYSSYTQTVCTNCEACVCGVA